MSQPQDSQAAATSSRPAAPVAGNTNTRKRPADSAGQAPTPKRHDPKPASSSTWTPEQTATLMGWFLEYQRTMEKEDIDASNYCYMFEHVRALAVKEWPDLAPLISTESIDRKFYRENQRYGALRAWTRDFGGSCDPVDGRCEIDRSDKRWKKFKNAASFEASAWVSGGLPLGDLKVYKEMWGHELATGAYIRSIDDAINPKVKLDLIEVPRHGRWQPASDDAPQRTLSDTLVRPPGLSDKQWHELATDPDWVESQRGSGFA